MILLGMLGPVQILLLGLLILAVPTGIFILGYRLGKKAGYIQRVKETENQSDKNHTE